MTRTPDAPGLATRLMARLSGEVPAAMLDGYRRAGLGVYDLLSTAEAKRAELASKQPAQVDDATRCFLACAWNAFALQTLGDAFVDADYAANPRTVGFVPPITKEQALAFYGEVEQWLRSAHEADANPHSGPPLTLPAELPAFAEVNPCPAEHLRAMLAASRTLREHAEVAIVDAEKLPGASEAQLAELRALLAAAGNAGAYAERLYGDGRVAQELHERIEVSVKESLSSYYLAGQLAAMPELIGKRPLPASVTGAGGRLAGPGEPGFDPWCLTDPRSREDWRRDRSARAAIDTLWDYDPDPRATLDLAAEVGAALEAGYAGYATGPGGERLGNYYCCPWSAIYVAKRPLTIGGSRLRAGQQFALDVSAEDVPAGGAFKRELVVANFTPTDRVDYCDPRAGGHDD